MSSELALYRRYRPEKFSEVVGQDHVVSVLTAAIREKRIVHAYIFAGSRGTGKTSIARIFAKDLGTAPSDIYEIDAASNRGIDEIRAIRDGVQTLPFNSEYKVYIIDEAHMLTKEAWNALLKTLEEPPRHVIFILATTESHKIPETILSRCQVFAFHTPSDEEVREVISRVAKSEKLHLDKESLNLLVLLGEGSFRDALGMLQKVATFSSDKKITVDEVEKITGAPRTELVHQLVAELVGGTQEKAFAILETLSGQNVDTKTLAKMLMRNFRLALLILLAPDIKKKLEHELSQSEFNFYTTLVKKPGADKIPAILKELLIAYGDIHLAYIKQLPLELALAHIFAKGEGSGGAKET